MKKISIIGSNGGIGRELTRLLLEKGYLIYAGQRSEPLSEFENNPNFTWKKTDVLKSNELREFCKNTEIIINCSAPSYLLGNKVAKIAADLGVIYIDYSEYMYSEYKKDNREFEFLNTNIIGAGFVPGFSGLLIKTICRTEFTQVDSVTGFLVVDQLCSKNGFIDFILSSKISGKSNAKIRNQKMEDYVFLEETKYCIPYFENEMYLKPYLSDELVVVSAVEKIPEFTWYNATFNREVKELINQIPTMFFDAKGNLEYSNIEKYYTDVVKQSESTQESTCMIIDVSGKINDICHRFVYVVNIPNINNISGKIGAQLVEKCRKRRYSNGYFWTNDIIQYKSIDEMNEIFGEYTIYRHSIQYGSQSLLNVDYEINTI